MTVSLGTGELARLQQAIEAVARVTDPTAFPAAAVSAAYGLVPCEVASYNEVLPDGATHAFWFPEAAMEATTATTMLGQYLHEHPVVMEILRTGDGSPRAISDFLTAEEFRSLELYKGLFGPMGLADQLSISLPAPRPLIIGIALNRDRRGFSAEDRALIGLLRPYLVQAHRSAHLAARLQAATAIGLTSRTGLVIHSNGRLEALAGHFPEWVPVEVLFPGGRLDDEVGQWFAAQEAGTSGSWSRPKVRMELPALTRPYLRTIGEVRWTFRRLDLAIGPVLVLTRGSEDSEGPFLTYRAMGLTEREAQVLQQLTIGRSNPEIARELGIARATVKRHLETIFRKLGVQRRTQAAALAIDSLGQA